MAAASEYVLAPTRDGAEFTLYRARQRRNPPPLPVVTPIAEEPLPQSSRRVEHEYSLASESEPSWAANPLALALHEGRTRLVLADSGDEPLDRVLERDRQQAPDTARILRLAMNPPAALRHARQRGLIHKGAKCENVLVVADRVGLTGFGIASPLPRERQAPVLPEIIAGSLACISPQRPLKRLMEIRSDLYPVGVFWCGVLKGMLPFIFNSELWPTVFSRGTNHIDEWLFRTSNSTAENADG